MSASTPSSVSAPVVIPRRTPILRDRGSVRRDSLSAPRWSVVGTSKVSKDVEAGAVELRGLLTVGGKFSSSSLRGRGTLEVQGAIDITDRTKLRGTIRAGATIHSGDLEVRGSVRSIGAIRIDRNGSIDGLLEAAHATADVLGLRGGAQLPGATRVTTLFTDLRAASTFGTISGRSVLIHGKVPNLVDKTFFRDRLVTVQRIDADTVSLEGVDAAFVRSPQIILGRGCHVTAVEGAIVRQHPTSYVGPESRTPPPYGLRR